VSAFAAAALAQADPMETGFASLKYGAVLIFLPFAFVYLPGVLLMGTLFEIIYTTAILLIGFLALAMALQGSDFLVPKITLPRRIIYTAIAMVLLFPSGKVSNIIALAVLAATWIPGLLAYRKNAQALKEQAGA
jgi:TRAP-type uncharacterized transport system fused permease subunit